MRKYPGQTDLSVSEREKKIRAEWLRWVHAGGQRLPGLVKRRQWECDRFFEDARNWDDNCE